MSQTKPAAGWQGDIDLDALLVALVLVPHSYPRNRFYQLYRSDEVRRVRRRATILRGLIAELAGDAVNVRTSVGEMVEIAYHLPEVGVERRSMLTADEHALVCSCVARRGVAPEKLAALEPPEGDANRQLEQRIAGLLP